MQFGSGLTVKTKEKPSDRLFLTEIDIVPLCRKTQNKPTHNLKHSHVHTGKHIKCKRAHTRVQTQNITDAVSQLSALAYMGEAKDLLPFFAPPFPLSSSTCRKSKTTGEDVMMEKFHCHQSVFSGANEGLIVKSIEGVVCRFSLELNHNLSMYM